MINETERIICINGCYFIIIMLVIPLPGGLLSVLILCNILLALIVILVSMNTQEALQFSIFPSLLLLLTLFRLGLNVSTTRSILSKADAGGVVDTFGSFVIGNNPLVGFVVFVILVIIQYIVITKGAERVSEVAARFTLDAMPGKQMRDRKSTRLNSSHVAISYAVFCLKKKTKQ